MKDDAFEHFNDPKLERMRRAFYRRQLKEHKIRKKEENEKRKAESGKVRLKVRLVDIELDQKFYPSYFRRGALIREQLKRLLTGHGLDDVKVMEGKPENARARKRYFLVDGEELGWVAAKA